MTTKAEEMKMKEKEEEERKTEKAEEEKKKEKMEYEEELQGCWMREAKKKKAHKEKVQFNEGLKKRGAKMALWCTRNYKPLITHGELEPIMETLGFVPLPVFPNPTTTKFDNVTIIWKEYRYSGAFAITTRTGAFRSHPHLTLKTPPPTPRLPYPRIDGLHLLTYRAFVDAVKFYHNKEFFGDHLHVRALPIDPIHDLHMSWCFMASKEYTMIYREGTLDDALFDLYPYHSTAHKEGIEFIEKDDYEDDDLEITMVSMDDIIVADKKNNGSSSRDHEVTETP